MCQSIPRITIQRIKLPKQIRNIALFAHVDAGKTSVSEQFLFHSGKIRTPGSVDKGNTQTDFLEIEKERGITINSTLLTFEWQDTQINLIDTPGHIDFSSETEKAIQAIDSAVVLISASEGVQAQTEHMIHLLQKHHKPFLIFINKIDRIGVDIEAVLNEIGQDFNLNLLPLQHVVKDDSGLSVQSIWDAEQYTNQIELIEKIVEQDSDLFEAYLEERSISFENLQDVLRRSLKNFSLVPVLMGSAKMNIGLADLLDQIVNLLPNAVSLSEETQGLVFKTKYSRKEGKWSAVRLFGGQISARELVLNVTKNVEEKVSLIKNTDLQNQQIVQSISAGEIAWIQGFNSAEPGDFIGNQFGKRIKEKQAKALLSVQVIPTKPSDINALIDALQIMNNEDPDLQFRYSKALQELHLNIRGEIQKEIIKSVLETRFDLLVEVSSPSVIYKETPTVSAEGYVRYWMPKPCWAIMRFKIEPGERGSGVQYKSIVGVNAIKQHYQNDVEKTLPIALKQGMLGWEVTDIKITLIEGEDHEAHTKSNDFAIATPMGIMDGLQKAEMTLLEPVFKFKIKAPEQNLGAITSELMKLRAELQNPEISKGVCLLTGEIPLSTSLDFPIKLSALTNGKAKYTSEFFKYKTCEVSMGQTRAFQGVSPLDRAKYILKARKALS